MFGGVADHRNPRSLAARFRQRRLALFAGLIGRLPAPVRVLDVGGTADFWRRLDADRDRLQITILNLTVEAPDRDGVHHVAGDARDLREFGDRSVDVVFSNSVIEHVGTRQDQMRMASEVRRVGRRYFVQTPNRYFPIEPHFLVPGFQFLPLRVRAMMLTRWNLGWVRRAPVFDDALREVSAIRLLSRRDVREMFPGAAIHTERAFGLAKSYVAMDGWDAPHQSAP